MSPEPRPKRGESKQNYATPPDFIAAVKRRLGIKAFAFDFAADASNTKATHFWSEVINSLNRHPEMWAAKAANGWGWLNPPFANITPWAARCAATKASGGQVAFLVPAGVGANWFRDHVDGHALVLLLNGRIHFDPTRPTWGFPKDCILCLYSEAIASGYEVWSWKGARR